MIRTIKEEKNKILKIKTESDTLTPCLHFYLVFQITLTHANAYTNTYLLSHTYVLCTIFSDFYLKTLNNMK